MSRKDYELIAKEFRTVVQASRSAVEVLVLRMMAKRLAKAFAMDNPRFDTDRFLSACGF